MPIGCLYFTIIDMNKEIEFPDPVLSPYTATMILAYLHCYAPPILERRRLVAVGHLRAMTAWLGCPQPHLRSVRHHLPLAAHFALLRASRLASFSGAAAMLQPGVTPWLHGEWPMQIDFLLAGLREETWQQALRELGLETTIRLDYTAYLQQVLERQRDAPPLFEPQAAWQTGGEEEEWRLHLPRGLPTWLLFDLLQLGEWQGGAQAAALHGVDGGASHAAGVWGANDPLAAGNGHARTNAVCSGAAAAGLAKTGANV